MSARTAPAPAVSAVPTDRPGTPGSAVPAVRVRRGDRIAERVAASFYAAAGMGAGLVVVALLIFLTAYSWPLVTQGHVRTLISTNWNPGAGSFGILPMVIGSLTVAGGAVLIAFPAGLGICLFLNGVGPRWAVRPLRTVIELMTGVPTVLYAFVAVFLLVPLLRNIAGGSGYSALSALLVVAVLITPTIVLTIDGRFEQLHEQLYLATVALGLTPVQRLAWVYLPAARNGLIAAMILGFGRAVGDTVIALMIAGNATQIPSSVTGAVRTLTSHIALVLAADTQSGAYYSLFAAGLLLFLFVLLANIALRYIESRELDS